MITRVRIAPVERWCAHYKPETHGWLIGATVEIQTETMREGFADTTYHSEPYRFWALTERSYKELEARKGKPLMTKYNTEPVICEHMLEMD